MEDRGPIRAIVTLSSCTTHSQGAGNALFPIFQANENPELSLHGFDYSKTAIDVVKVHWPRFFQPLLITLRGLMGFLT
jgi:hypothetical protein